MKVFWIPTVLEEVKCPSGLIAIVKPFDGKSQVVLTQKNKTAKDRLTELAKLILVSYGGDLLAEMTEKQIRELFEIMPPADRTAILIQARYLSLFDSDEELKDDKVLYSKQVEGEKKTIEIPVEGFNVSYLETPFESYEDFVENGRYLEFTIGSKEYQIERAACKHLLKLAKVNEQGDISIISLLNVRNPKVRNESGEWVAFDVSKAKLKTLKALQTAINQCETEIDTLYGSELGSIDILTETDFFLAI
jgi:hypothetical protein